MQVCACVLQAFNKLLRERYAQQVIIIDEFRTSKVCRLIVPSLRPSSPDHHA